MAIDINAIKGRLNKLQNTKRKSDLFWKPKPGKTTVRIVPYKYNQDNPFMELLFHYNINNKTYLSPQSFGRPDPIAEFADKLKSLGSKEEWKAGKGMEPKLRTFVPIVVRGEENQGVKFWGFGKTVYQEILGYIADPDYGDITDPMTGTDITIEYTSAQDAGTSYPVTQIRVKRASSALLEDTNAAVNLIKNQTKITDLYEELTYEELSTILKNHLNPEEAKEEANTAQSTTLEKRPTSFEEAKAQTTETKAEVPKTETKEPAPTVEKPAVTKNADVAAAFADIFNKK